jgi:symplekin
VVTDHLLSLRHFVHNHIKQSSHPEAVQDLIAALIRSLGPGHGKLLTLMRTFPPGAETLALRILNIFTEQGRPNARLVALVRGLISEWDLDLASLFPLSQRWISRTL